MEGSESASLSYRVFPVNERGRLTHAPEIIKAESDQEACRQAERLVGHHSVELWEGARLVARFTLRDGQRSTSAPAS